MKLPRSLAAITLAGIVLAAGYLYLNSPPAQLSPVSKNNSFYAKLNHALNVASLTPSNMQWRNFIEQVEFHLNNTDVILSTQKDPYAQVASLQKILNTAKIKDKNVILIDLSTPKPYATLQDN